MRRLRLLAAIFSVLLLATVALSAVDRFEVAGPDLLVHSAEEPAWSLRTVHAEAHLAEGLPELELVAPCPEEGCRAHATQLVAARGPAYVRAVARLRWDGVVVGEDLRHRGPRLHLGSRAPDERWHWHPPFHPMELEGSGEGWVTQSFHVDGRQPEWGLWVDLSGVEGSLQVEQIALYRLALHPWWWRCFVVVAAGWAAAILAALWPSLLACRRSLAHAGVVFATVALLAGTLAPDEHVNPIRRGIVQTVHRVDAWLLGAPTASEGEAPPVDTPPPTRSTFSVDKTGHFLGFCLLAVSALAAWPLAWRTVAWLLPLSIVSEALQGLTLSRTPRWLDVGVDLCGIALGASLAWAWSRWRSRRDSSS